MTLITIHFYEEDDQVRTKVEIIKKITSIWFENQYKNGYWLCLTKEDGANLSIEFDPEQDLFEIH